MLVLTRNPGEKIHIGSDSAIIVVNVKGNKIQIGIDATKEVTVLRAERNEVLDHIELLKDADKMVRCQAAESLVMEKGSEEAAVSALVTLLQGAGAGVKVAVARALATLKKAAAPAVSALIPLLHDQEETVRTAASEAIAQFGRLSEAATGSLAEGLASPDSGPSSPR
jgi:carbon storage regulator CsrA